MYTSELMCLLFVCIHRLNMGRTTEGYWPAVSDKISMEDVVGQRLAREQATDKSTVLDTVRLL